MDMTPRGMIFHVGRIVWHCINAFTDNQWRERLGLYTIITNEENADSYKDHSKVKCVD